MIKIGTIGIILCILYAATKESMGLTSLESIKYVLDKFNGNTKIILETSARQGTEMCADIENLGKTVQERVYKKFNINLEWEIKIIGETSD